MVRPPARPLPHRVPARGHASGPARLAVLAAILPAAAAVFHATGTLLQAAPPHAADPRRPNVLLLVSDDQRPDTIAALGNPEIKTPALDQLARRGFAFTRAICGNPICTPSRGEILTGVASLRNGVHDFGGKLRPELALLPQTFQAAGYQTWYVGKWHNDGRPTTRGYIGTRGLFASGGAKYAKPQVDWRGQPVTGYRGWIFQSADGKQQFPERGVGLTPEISQQFADAAIELLHSAAQQPEQPFLIHVNFTAPHDPLLVPPAFADAYDPQRLTLPKNFLPQHPFDHGNYNGRDEMLWPWPRTPELVRQTLAVYYAVLSDLDRQVGRILTTLEQTGLAENTVVVYTSDHGLAVGSHGLRGKQNMYDHTLGVPLLLAGPGVPGGKRSQAQTCLRDIFPTLCQLAKIPVPATVEGRSLLPVLADPDHPLRRYQFAAFRDRQRMIRSDRWKLIHYPLRKRYQLFDLQADPQETRDLAQSAEHQPTLRALKQLLARWEAEPTPLVEVQ